MHVSYFMDDSRSTLIYLSSCNQPDWNCHRSSTFILPSISQRLDVPKSRSEYRCFNQKDFLTLSLVQGWGSRVGMDLLSFDVQ